MYVLHRLQWLQLLTHIYMVQGATAQFFTDRVAYTYDAAHLVKVKV